MRRLADTPEPLGQRSKHKEGEAGGESPEAWEGGRGTHEEGVAVVLDAALEGMPKRHI